MSSRSSGDGEARLNQKNPSDSHTVAEPPDSNEASEGVPQEQEHRPAAMESGGNSESQEKLADHGDTANGKGMQRS